LASIDVGGAGSPPGLPFLDLSILIEGERLLKAD
jgi:hypothetical protein